MHSPKPGIISLFILLIIFCGTGNAGITRSGDIITISTDGAGTTGSTLALAYTMLDVYNADVGGNWNVVHKQGGNQYKVDCSMTVGGPSGTTYFKFIKEDFLFCGETFQVGGGTMPWHYYPGIVHLGEMVDGEPVNGSTFTFGYTGGAAETRIYNKAETLHIYNSQIKTITAVPSKVQISNAGPLVMNRAIIDGITSPFYEVVSNWQMDVDNSVIQNANIGVYMEDISRRMAFNDLIFKNCNTGIYNYGMGGVTTLLNMKTKNTPLLVDVDTSGWTLRLVNPEIETWHVNVRYGNTYIYRVHSIDLRITDSNNFAIPGTVVNIYDLDNNLVVNMTTVSDGRLIDNGTATSGSPTSLFDTSKSWAIDVFKGYLVEITVGTGAGQIRGIETNTATEIKIGGGASNWWKTNPDSTSEYKITPVLEYGYIPHGVGDTFTMRTPHTMTITSTGYVPKRFNFTVDEKINWLIPLTETTTSTTSTTSTTAPGTTTIVPGHLQSPFTPHHLFQSFVRILGGLLLAILGGLDIIFICVLLLILFVLIFIWMIIVLIGVLRGMSHGKR